MAWRPPLTLEEWCRLRIVPGRLDVLYHMKRELRTGERELALVPFLADRRRVSVDAGANKGVWTEMMRRYSAHVHAFEPNPKLFRFLRRGVGRGVSCHALALSDATGLAELKVPCGSKGYSNQGASLSAVKIGNGNFRFLEVATTRLDDLELGDVGFIKIDVEGHEMAVIDGASETLRRCRPALIVEIEERHTQIRIEELIDRTRSHGYDAFALSRGALKRFEELDLEACHRHPATHSDYVFNWIFLPVANSLAMQSLWSTAADNSAPADKKPLPAIT